MLQNDAKNTIDTCKLLLVLCSIRLNKVLLCFILFANKTKICPKKKYIQCPERYRHKDCITSSRYYFLSLELLYQKLI